MTNPSAGVEISRATDGWREFRAPGLPIRLIGTIAGGGQGGPTLLIRRRTRRYVCAKMFPLFLSHLSPTCMCRKEIVFFLRKGRALLIKLECLHLERHNAQRNQENDRAKPQRAGQVHELKHLTLSLSAGTLPWEASVPPLVPRR